jgi:hypothetical protein
MDNFEKNEGGRDEIFSKVISAGKRKYFIDVKTTKRNDLYLTLSESRKRWKDNGEFYYEKHKLFLYKEDFEKFAEGLQECIDKVEELRQSGEYAQDDHESSYTRFTDNSDSTKSEESDSGASDKFTDLDFDDLGSDK